MTAVPSRRELPVVYYRRAALPTAAIVVAGTLLAAILEDRSQALGIVVGGLIVLVFFGVDVVALRMSSSWDPAVIFLLVMIVYFSKIVVLGLMLAPLRSQDVVSIEALGLSVGLGTFVFLTFLVVAHVQVPTFVVEPTEPGSDVPKST